MKENNSDKDQAISKLTFLETPLPKKRTIFFEGFLPEPLKWVKLKRTTHISNYLCILHAYGSLFLFDLTHLKVYGRNPSKKFVSFLGNGVLRKKIF